MATEYGLYSYQNDGIFESGFWSQDAAAERLKELVAEDPDYGDDTTVVPVCPNHSDYSATDCPCQDAD